MVISTKIWTEMKAMPLKIILGQFPLLQVNLDTI